MKEDRIEWDSDKGKYVKKYAMWDSNIEEYYYDSPKGIMITIKAPKRKKEGTKYLLKHASKLIRRMNLVILLNKIPYVNARMIE